MQCNTITKFIYLGEEELTDLNKLSADLFTKKKEDRNRVIPFIIKNLDYFYQACIDDDIHDYPHYYVVARAIDAFLKDNQFIFQIAEKKAGLVSRYERMGGIFSKEMALKFTPSFDKGIYLVNLLHLIGKENLQKQIDLLIKEGFGKRESESVEEAKERLLIFIGLNYCHSLDSTQNKVNKCGLKNILNQETSPSVHYETFRWSPQWTLQKELSNETIDEESKTQKFSKKILPWFFEPGQEKRKHLIPQFFVKSLFKILQQIDPNKASNLYGALMKKKVVPYQSLREHLKNSPPVTFFLKHIRFNRQNHPCFLSIVDDDAVRLRNEGLGLFSHYDKLFSKNPKLELASTGYFMKDPANDYVEYGSRVNLAARQGSFARPSAVYYPEPNMIAKIPSGNKFPPQFSFVRKGIGKEAGNLESIGLVENLNLMGSESREKILFGTEGAIQTAVSPNVKVPKHLKGKINSKEFPKSENLSSLRSFSQTAINPLEGFAKNTMRSFPNHSSTNENKSSLSKIYTAFDPIEYAKSLSVWVDCWEFIMNNIIESYNSKRYFLENGEVLFEKSIKDNLKELKLNESLEMEVIDLIKSNTLKLYEAKKNLLKNGFTLDEIVNCIQLSVDMNCSVFNFLQKKIYSNR